MSDARQIVPEQSCLPKILIETPVANSIVIGKTSGV